MPYTEENTVRELKAAATEQDLEFKPNANKAELLELLNADSDEVVEPTEEEQAAQTEDDVADDYESGELTDEEEQAQEDDEADVEATTPDNAVTVGDRDRKDESVDPQGTNPAPGSYEPTHAEREEAHGGALHRGLAPDGRRTFNQLAQLYTDGFGGNRLDDAYQVENLPHSNVNLNENTGE